MTNLTAPATQVRTRKTARAPAKRAGVRRLKSENVVDSLGLKIVSGSLAAGTLLPTEAEFCRRLGISRPSLREGLRALALKGLVEGRTRRGTVINDKQHWNVLDPDVLRWYAAAAPDPAFFMDLLDVRAIFEPAAAQMAAARATPAQILAIEDAFKAMAASLPHDVEACCAHDLAFHENIIAATGNRMLVGFAGAIRTALLAAFRLSSNARESYENSLAEHWAVAVAIRRRDPAEAEKAMRVLLQGTARDLAPAYNEYRRGKAPARPQSGAKTKRPRRTSR
jgi:GntR family transcriptional regulator, galactonate operon transcriptional repressor